MKSFLVLLSIFSLTTSADSLMTSLGVEVLHKDSYVIDGLSVEELRIKKPGSHGVENKSSIVVRNEFGLIERGICISEYRGHEAGKALGITELSFPGNVVKHVGIYLGGDNKTAYPSYSRAKLPSNIATTPCATFEFSESVDIAPEEINFDGVVLNLNSAKSSDISSSEIKLKDLFYREGTGAIGLSLKGSSNIYGAELIQSEHQIKK